MDDIESGEDKGEERPSTLRRSSGEPSLGTGAGDEFERVQANKHREVQVARTGGRKLFDRERRAVFLEWFAATCNVSMSAERAGINYKTAFRHRMNDADFAADWDRAAEQAIARLKAKQLETKAREVRIGIEGDLDAPEMEDIDPAIAATLLREHERRLAGYPKQGRAPRVASNAEVRAALTKALQAFRQRAEARRAGAGIASSSSAEAEGPLHRPSDGSPPRAGEDL